MHAADPAAVYRDREAAAERALEPDRVSAGRGRLDLAAHRAVAEWPEGERVGPRIGPATWMVGLCWKEDRQFWPRHEGQPVARGGQRLESRTRGGRGWLHRVAEREMAAHGPSHALPDGVVAAGVLQPVVRWPAARPPRSTQHPRARGLGLRERGPIGC